MESMGAVADAGLLKVKPKILCRDRCKWRALNAPVIQINFKTRRRLRRVPRPSADPGAICYVQPAGLLGQRG
jgi:hypothetical protein